MGSRISRESLLSALQAVKPGLESRESIEQSSCVVFRDGHLMTFNNEICAALKSPVIDIEGAVKASLLMSLLSKLKDDLIEVSQDDGRLEILCKGGKKAGIAMEAKVYLPVEKVERPTEWLDLDPLFFEGVDLVQSCASRDTEQGFVWTCIHVHPDFLEATDRSQICRYRVKTAVPEELLVQAKSLKALSACGAKQFSVSKSWLHFKNPAGLILSVRRYSDPYRSLDEFLGNTTSYPITLPGGLSEIIARCELFSADNADGNVLTVDLKSGFAVIEGEGPAGYYKEKTKVVYDGEEIRFRIAAKLLLSVLKRGTECRVSVNRLYIDGIHYQYVTSLLGSAVPKKKREKKSEQPVPVSSDDSDDEVPF